MDLMYRYKYKRDAFTLVEIMLVVVLIAIIAASSAGVYLGSHKAAVLKKASRDVMLAMNYAREMAIKNNCPCEIVFNTISGNYHLQTFSIDSITDEISMTIVKDHYFKPCLLPDGVIFADIQFDNTVSGDTWEHIPGKYSVKYSPNGSCKCVVITIKDGRGAYSIVSKGITGIVKMERGISMFNSTMSGSLDLDTFDEELRDEYLPAKPDSQEVEL